LDVSGSYEVAWWTLAGALAIGAYVTLRRQ
jgi:hypothetical protein